MTREEKYIAQLKALEIWDEAFRPEVSELAQLEREKTRVKKAWAATAEPGEKPDFTDPLYKILVDLRREILVHRESLGLTPKSLRRLKGSFGEVVNVGAQAEEPDPERVTVLDLVREKFAL